MRSVPTISVSVCVTPILFFAVFAHPASSQPFTLTREPDAIVIQSAAGQSVVRYQLTKPVNSKLPVESGCFFHPVSTPKGTVITEVAPADHPHHRGVFLAWVEMHGKKDADFWGWGEHAPTKNRRIINREVTNLIEQGPRVGFTARNEWVAEDQPVMAELLQASIHSEREAYVIDLAYTFTPAADLTLSQWAFSGFCVRTRKDGQLEAYGPDGPVPLPNPKHTEPTSDWPASKWYGYTLRLDGGATAGVAVIDHSKNPHSLWHNHRDVRMLNPCIVAPAALTLKAGQPLVLRYRVVTHDGPTPQALLEALTKDW